MKDATKDAMNSIVVWLVSLPELVVVRDEGQSDLRRGLIALVLAGLVVRVSE